jgi:hypothetical protein
MNNDSIIGVFVGIMLSIVVLYLISGFICGVFCNNNRDNNRDNDNNTTNALHHWRFKMGQIINQYLFFFYYKYEFVSFFFPVGVIIVEFIVFQPMLRENQIIS